MRYSTQYLFGVPRSFFEPEQSILATKKIAAAKALKKEISKLKNTATDSELPALAKRWQKADDAEEHWEKILHEEDE